MTNQQQPSVTVYTQGGGTASSASLGGTPFVTNVAPSTTSVKGPNGPFAVGQSWINTATNSAYVLTSYSPSNGTMIANWEIDAGGSSLVSTLTGTSGGAVGPTAGNINILGTAAQVQFVGNPATSTLTASLIGPYTPATYTAHGVLVGEAATSIVATAAGTTGQVLTATTSADPAFAALGTGSGLTAHGVLLGEGAGAIVATAAGATGTVLAGTTSADPAFTATPTVTSITFGAGSALGAYVAPTAFTPVLAFGGNSVGITYSTQTGTYVKIGQLVFIGVVLVLTSKGSSSGTATITGLPFTALNTAPTQENFVVQYLNVTLDSGDIPAAAVDDNGTAISLLEQSASSVPGLSNTYFANNSAIYVTGFYFSAT